MRTFLSVICILFALAFIVTVGATAVRYVCDVHSIARDLHIIASPPTQIGT